MKPYTIESYKAGKKPICRNGVEPTEFHYFETSDKDSFVVVIDGDLHSFNSNGEFLSVSPHKLDLFEKPEKREYWVIVYRGRDGGIYDGGIYVSMARTSEQEAREIGSKSEDYLCIVKVWEEEV